MTIKHTLAVTLMILLTGALSAHAKKGFYFGFNLGGAIVSGEKNIAFAESVKLQDPDQPFSDQNVLFSTDVGGGFATNFRLGYNILGVVAIEANFGGSGNGLGDSDNIEGQASVGGLVRIFPAQFFPEVADRWWDPYIFLGGAGHFIGYNPQARPEGQSMQNDGRAWWPGVSINYGLGADFYVSPFFSLGIDLAFANVRHNTFHIDDKKDITISPIDPATAFIFTPTAKLTFHFLTN